MTSAQKIVQYVAFGWLGVGGVLHFAIDVVAQYVRGVRAPGPEATLYYGMNTAYAFGQVLVGLFGLWLCWRAPSLFAQWPLLALSLAAAGGWLAFSFVFIEYWEPKFAAGVFALLVVARIALA